jgi:hypothetical protein
MKITKTLKDLCSPAALYLIISVITILVALFSGVKIIAIAMKGVFAIFWTFILNLLCQNGFKSVSWFLVLFPYVVMAGAFAITFLKMREGFTEMGINDDDASKVAGGAMASKIMKGKTSNQKKEEAEKKMKENERKGSKDQMKKTKNPEMDEE